MKALAKFKRVAVAACAVAAGLFAQAETEPTSYWAWDETKQAVVEQAPVNAAVLNKAFLTLDGDTTLAGGWYVVKGEVKTTGDSGNIVVEPGKTVNIILADDADFQLDECSLIVNKGSTLNIYGQAKNTGKLTIDLYKDGAPTLGESFDAAIGGAEELSNGAINIHGGVITVKAYWGAGIGAGGADSEYDLPDQEGPITFYGGVVNAYSRKGAGIGGGSDTDSGDVGEYGNGGVVRTYGGVVVGRSIGHGSGIGGGCSGNGCDFHADGACIVGQAEGTWDAWNPAHGIGRGYWGHNDGTNTVDRSTAINYVIKHGDLGYGWLADMSADDFEQDAQTLDLDDDVYYFSWEHTIGINPAPHLDVSYSVLQMDGTEGETKKVETKQFVKAKTFYGLYETPTYTPEYKIGYPLPENVGISNGVHVVYTCQDGYVFPDGKKTRDLWIAPSRVRGNLNLEVGGVGPYDLPAPTVAPAPPFFLYPNGDGGKFVLPTRGKYTFLGAIVNTNGEVAGSITVTLKAPNNKKLFDVSATVKTLANKKSYSFKAKKIELPTNDAPFKVHMAINKTSEHHELDVVFDGDSVTGVFDFANKVDAARDVFATKNDPKQASLKSSFITKWSGLLGSSVSNELYSLSAVVSKNGKTKVTVMQADGRKANCSAKAVIGANGVVAVPVTLWTKVGKEKATIGFWLTFEEKDGKPVCAVQRLSAVRDQKYGEKLVGLSFTAGDAAVLAVTSKEFKASFKPVFDSAAGKARGEPTKNGLKLASNGFITGSLTWGSGKTKVTGKAYGAMVDRVGGATLKLKDGTTDVFMVAKPAK